MPGGRWILYTTGNDFSQHISRTKDQCCILEEKLRNHKQLELSNGLDGLVKILFMVQQCEHISQRWIFNDSNQVAGRNPLLVFDVQKLHLSVSIYAVGNARHYQATWKRPPEKLTWNLKQAPWKNQNLYTNHQLLGSMLASWVPGHPMICRYALAWVYLRCWKDPTATCFARLGHTISCSNNRNDWNH